MTDRPADRNLWCDFAHTLTVTVASSLAADDLAHGHHEETSRHVKDGLPGNLQQTRVKQFEIRLLAAAGAELALPRQEILTPDGAIGIRFEPGEGEIRVHLQLKGFAALSSFAHRAGRLTGSDGVVDHAFRFDQEGAALCVLADTPAIRAALGNLRILLDLDT